MKKFFFFFLIPALAFAGPEKPFTLKGTLNTPDAAKMAYLYYQSGNDQVQDSVEVTNDQFAFKGKLGEATLATFAIKFEKPDGKTNFRYEKMTLFLEPGNININVKDSLKFATVSGSRSHTSLEQFNKLKKPYDDARQAMSKEYILYNKNKDQAGMKRMESQFDSLDEKMKEEVFKPYIQKNPKSPIALFVLQQYAGFAIDPNKVEPLFSALPRTAQNSHSGKDFKKQIETAKKTAIGSYAINFTQNDTLDQPVSLSSFKGKYVLLDFWASWCGPCRAENPNVVKAFNKYKDKNFTVLSVSLDQPGKKQAWLDAIHKDGMLWTHVSDLKFWNNAVAKLYGIQAIPQNLLIDPTGKIIAKNLRGDDLENKLSVLLN